MDGEIVYPLTGRESWIVTWCTAFAYIMFGVVLTVGVMSTVCT